MPASPEELLHEETPEKANDSRIIRPTATPARTKTRDIGRTGPVAALTAVRGRNQARAAAPTSGTPDTSETSEIPHEPPVSSVEPGRPRYTSPTSSDSAT